LIGDGFGCFPVNNSTPNIVLQFSKPSQSRDQRLYVARLCVIFAICLLSYANTLKVPFQFDGVAHIHDNRWIKSFPIFFNDFGIANLWNRSIAVFTYTLNYYLGKDNTFGYHLFNLFVHFGVCVLIYLVVRKILVHSRLKGMATPNRKINIPFVSALLFASHPAHTQAATYLMSRGSLLVTFFYLGSFYCFLLAVEGKSPTSVSGWKKIQLAGWVIFALLLMILGFGSKLTIITAPILMVIYYLMFFRNAGENFFRFLRRKLRWLVLMILPFLTFVVYKAFFTHRGLLGIPDLGAMTYSRMDYFLTEIKMATFYYLKVLLFPINLNVDPDINLIRSYTDPLLILSTLLLIAYITFIKNQSKPALFGFLWFVITIAPESSIIPLTDIVAEHRLYLPGVGFVLMTCVLLSDRRWLPFYIALLIFFTANTVHRNSVWFSEITLWRDTAKKSPGKSRPFINYARALHLSGKIEPAIENYKKAIERDPYYFESHHNLAEAYAQSGKCRAAIKEFEYALILVPELVESMVGLGRCYKTLGNYSLADAYFKKALKTRPSSYAAFFELGLLHYFNMHEKEKGRFYLQQALRLNPNLPGKESLKNLLKE